MARLSESQARQLQKGEELSVYLIGEGWRKGHFHSHCWFNGAFAVRVIVPPKDIPTTFYLQHVKLPKLEEVGIFRMEGINAT